MVKGGRTEWKNNYFVKMGALLEQYEKIIVVGADNVRSKQMQDIRINLRGEATILMGKNTMMRKVIRGLAANNPKLEKLLPFVRFNVGFVFTNKDIKDIRDIIQKNRLPAHARAGALAPSDVYVPPQNTGLGPEKTNFFQALQIATKIARGSIEIINEVYLIKAGEKVGASEATLLNMLKISPFTYGLEMTQIYDDGQTYSPEVLDISDDDIIKMFLSGVRNVAAVSLQIGYPTVASVPHSIANGFKNVLAVAAETDITFKEAEKLKSYLADPSKFAVAALVTNAAAPAAAAKKEVVEEEEEESDDDMGFGLFD